MAPLRHDLNLTSEQEETKFSAAATLHDARRGGGPVTLAVDIVLSRSVGSSVQREPSWSIRMQLRSVLEFGGLLPKLTRQVARMMC
jgi:hypothetical protein